MDNRWTVMIYLAGDSENSLSTEMIFYLHEMKKAVEVGPDKQVTVLVFFDPSGIGYPAKRYVINKRETLERDVEPWSEDESNTGDPESILGFIEWGIKNYEADHYMVVLSGHGSGAGEDSLLPDQSPEDSLTLNELHNVLHEVFGMLGRPLDILAMDCCLMSMAEVCHAAGEVSIDDGYFKYVNYLIAAEGFELLTGWPYAEILSAISNLAKNGKGPAEISRKIVDEYLKYYSDYKEAGVYVDLSAISLQNYAALSKAIRGMSNHLTRKLNDGDSKLMDALRLAHLEAESFFDNEYVDLVDFCDCLEPRSQKHLKGLCKAVKKATQSLILQHGCTDPDRCSNGISVYLPFTEPSERYGELQFAKDTCWDQFLGAYSGNMFSKSSQIAENNRGPERKPRRK